MGFKWGEGGSHKVPGALSNEQKATKEQTKRVSLVRRILSSFHFPLFHVTTHRLKDGWLARHETDEKERKIICRLAPER